MIYDFFIVNKVDKCLKNKNVYYEWNEMKYYGNSLYIFIYSSFLYFYIYFLILIIHFYYDGDYVSFSLFSCDALWWLVMLR